MVADTRFAFVHLDLDLPGAILIGDDYADRDVRGVLGAFFAERPDTVVELPWGQVMVIRQG